MDLREINFGVEIETVKRTRERVARAIQSAVGGEVRHTGRPVSFDPWEVVDDQGRTWKVVSDGSLINVPGHLRAEGVSPVLAYEDIPILQEVIRAVRRSGAKVDEKCGIHVHVDTTPFDGRTLGNLAKIIYKQEPLILTALGVNENRQRNYSKPVSDDFIKKIERRRPKTKDQLNRIWYGYHNRRPQHFDSTRYYGVNLHNVWYRGTVEFRWFEGTLHASKVRAYIQLVLAVAACTRCPPAFPSCRCRKRTSASILKPVPDKSAGQRIWTCQRHARRVRAMDGEHQSATASDWAPVYGEFLTFDDPSTRLPAIDRLEGFHPCGRSLYRRVLVPVWAAGAVFPAWLYIGSSDRPGCRLLSPGRWPS